MLFQCGYQNKVHYMMKPKRSMSPPMITLTILVITTNFVMLESNLLSVTVTTVHEVKVTAIVTSTTYIRCYFNYRHGL